MPAPATRNLTILLTDIKGFTDKTSQRSRADIQRLLDEHRDIVLPVLQGKGGRLVKTIGDAFLMAFDSPTDAVLAGVAAQDALAKRNEGKADDDRIDIRIAINAGEVNLVEGDVFGEPVNIASRIESVTEAGEVYFTEAVYLAMNKTEVPSSEIGLLQLKGIPEKVRVYKVRRETPVGVGQMPERKPAPAAAAGFASGEKARMAVPAGAPTAAAAPPAAPAAVPPTWRRAAALIIDGVICSIIVGVLTGKPGHTVNVSKRLGRPESVSLGKKGVTVDGDDVRVKIDETGIHVDEGKDGARKIVYDNGKGVRVTDEEESPEQHRGKIFFALAWAIYSVLFLKWINATPGKAILKLKIVSAADGAPPTKRQRWLRSLVSVVSGYALFLGYLWAFFEPQRRGWHDLVAGTRVVAAD